MKKKLSFSLVAVLMLSVLMMLTACQAKFGSVADYANSDEVQKIVAKSQSEDATCRVFAEGDTLVLEYRLTYDIESQYLSEAADLIKTELDKNPSVFTDVKNEMKVYCNVANPRCVMRYYTKDGTLIIEYEPENY
ncbi:MAG: DUF4854 domain-containing protein [Acutalibacteraceae bacterium]